MRSMLQQERHNQILAKLNLEGQVKVKALSQEFHVSEDCIRKDLKILEKAKQLKRIHGGAMLLRENLHTYYVDERKNIRIKEKQMIASKAVKLIHPGMVVFLDISTVTLEIAKLIYQQNLNVTVITNMIDIMNIFVHDCATQLIFLGGKLNHARDGFIGSLTIDQLKKYKFDLSFIGVVGMDVYEAQVSTYDVDDGLTKQEVIHSSKKSYIVGETVKFGLDGNYVFADMEDFSGYICEQSPDMTIYHKLIESGLEII